MSPSMRTESMRSFSRLTERRRVDLPQPEGPIKAVTLPRGMVMEMSWRACLAPYQRLKRSISRTDSSASTSSWMSLWTSAPAAMAASRLSVPTSASFPAMVSVPTAAAAFCVCMFLSSLMPSLTVAPSELVRHEFPAEPRPQPDGRQVQGRDDQDQEQRGGEHHGLGGLGILALEA